MHNIIDEDTFRELQEKLEQINTSIKKMPEVSNAIADYKKTMASLIPIINKLEVPNMEIPQFIDSDIFAKLKEISNSSILLRNQIVHTTNFLDSKLLMAFKETASELLDSFDEVAINAPEIEKQISDVKNSINKKKLTIPEALGIISFIVTMYIMLHSYFPSLFPAPEDTDDKQLRVLIEMREEIEQQNENDQRIIELLEKQSFKEE